MSTPRTFKERWKTANSQDLPSHGFWEKAARWYETAKAFAYSGDKLEAELAAVTKERDELEGQVKELQQWRSTHDEPIPEDEEIEAAGPWNDDGDHAPLYATAMRLVSAKKSKSALVALVNWLLVMNAEIKLKAGTPAEGPSDGEMLDHLQSVAKGYGKGWILRESKTGRGMRLHETSDSSAKPTVREAIADAMKGDQ